MPAMPTLRPLALQIQHQSFIRKCFRKHESRVSISIIESRNYCSINFYHLFYMYHKFYEARIASCADGFAPWC